MKLNRRKMFGLIASAPVALPVVAKESAVGSGLMSMGLNAVNSGLPQSSGPIGMGNDVEVVLRKRRSGPQQRLYWRTLSEVVAATDKWPTSKHLHNDLKLALGYVEKHVNAFNGAMTYQADSTAFEKMKGDEFKTYFDRAMKLIAESCGFDPLAQYEARRAA